MTYSTRFIDGFLFDRREIYRIKNQISTCFILCVYKGLCKFKENPIAKDVLSLFVMHIKRNRTPLKYIGYGLYLYFLGLSYGNTSKALAQFVNRSHVAFWKWIQRYRPRKIAREEKNI